MRKYSLYDADKLAELTKKQKDAAWDLETSIAWDTSLNLDRPLVALDDKSLTFPGASQEQRLVISQFMGLIISACICEMEEALLRMRKECWQDLHENIPVSPEFIELGECFFEEEKKHSQAFRRYISKFAETTGIDEHTLIDLLPKVENTTSEFILRQNMKQGGQCFWWIVAIVEQQFLTLYHTLRPFKDNIEPLYYDLHQKHFEEEARHAPFPYLVLELLATRNHRITRAMHTKLDLVAAQLIQSAWAIHSLSRIKKIKKLEKEHPFFQTLTSAYPLFESMPPQEIFKDLFTQTPYIGTLLNTGYHKKIIEFSDKLGALSIPFPRFKTTPLKAI